MSRKISRILLAIVAVSLLIISTGCFKRDIIIASNNDPLILSESDGTYTFKWNPHVKGNVVFKSGCNKRCYFNFLQWRWN